MDLKFIIVGRLYNRRDTLGVLVDGGLGNLLHYTLNNAPPLPLHLFARQTPARVRDMLLPAWFARWAPGLPVPDSITLNERGVLCLAMNAEKLEAYIATQRSGDADSPWVCLVDSHVQWVSGPNVTASLQCPLPELEPAALRTLQKLGVRVSPQLFVPEPLMAD